MTPPGGTWGKSLKRGRSSAPGAIRQDLPSARFPPLSRNPVLSSQPPPPTAGKCHGQWRQPRVCPTLDSSGWGYDRRVAPKFLEGRGGQLQHQLPACSRSEGVALDWGGLEAATRGGARRQPPARSRKHTRATARGTWCAPGYARQPQPAPGRDPGSMPARLPAGSPCGRSRSHRQVALGGWPSRPESRRARPSGHPSRSFCALHPSVPISGRSLFSHLPVPGPGRLIQCLVINLAFQNGQRAG